MFAAGTTAIAGLTRLGYEHAEIWDQYNGSGPQSDAQAEDLTPPNADAPEIATLPSEAAEAFNPMDCPICMTTRDRLYEFRCGGELRRNGRGPLYWYGGRYR